MFFENLTREQLELMETAGYYVPDPSPPLDRRLVRGLAAAQATLHRGDDFMHHLQDSESAIVARAVTAAWEVFNEKEEE